MYRQIAKHIFSIGLNWECYRGRISFRFARIKIDFKVSIITHFNGEIDSHIMDATRIIARIDSRLLLAFELFPKPHDVEPNLIFSHGQEITINVHPGYQ